MARLVDAANKSEHQALLAAMFRDRKTVFVDQLGWKLSVLDGLEQDGFDRSGAEYLILRDPGSADHLGSLRLLRTDRPHILDTLFPELCEGPIPKGPAVREISRLCLSPRFPRAFAADYRAHLATALVEFALLRGVCTYTGVVTAAGLPPLLSRGWACQPLGIPRRYGEEMLVAVRIDIDGHTIAQLRRTGNYRANALDCPLGIDLVAA
jgi:N-acyl-L-homoserine lactone synthetase